MRKFPLMGLAVPCSILLMVLGASYGLIATIDYAVRDASEREASQWVGELSPSTLAWLFAPDGEDTGAALHDVFRRDVPQRITVFDTAGAPINRFGAGQAAADAADRLAPDPMAIAVIETGKPLSSLAAQSDASGALSRLAEVYIPRRDATGQIEGVIKLQFDRTETLQSLHTAAIVLSIVLSLVFAVVMFGLYAAFVAKRRQERRAVERAEYLATYDQLSGVLNRTGVLEQVDAAPFPLADAAVFYIDIDHFKQINDAHGHKAGDAVVQHVGAALKACCGPDSITGRLGGDEFVAIVRCADVAAAETLARRLRAWASQPIRSEGELIRTSLSIGIAYGGDPSMNFAERAHRADIALYQAKLDGRHTQCLFTEDLEQAIQRRRCIESSITTGLERGMFDVHFQPLVDRRTRACVGFEALLRLTGPQGEAVSPAEFIPIAESMGAISRLGAFVLERAAQAAADWPAPLFVAVNLSPRQFDDGTITHVVRGVLQRTGLAASRLELEVTETLVMENTESVGRQLSDLRALGVSVAMDDFGTGHSGLGTLWRFGFDKLKIDRSFIAGLETGGARAREILDTIIALGHRLNMVVTAEGIETTEQARVLSELACDQLQGFLFGVPMPADQLPRDLFAFRRHTDPPAIAALRDGTTG